MTENKPNVNNKETPQEARLLDHEADGIREFDNNLPRWWLGTFYITIVFSVFYFGYYVMGPGPALTTTFEKERAAEELYRLEHAPKDALPSHAELKEALRSADQRKAGQAIFRAKCVSCHGPEGQGGIGPNLTDDYWIHGGKLTEIVKTVSEGVLTKGMPAWGPLLSKQELVSVTAYVRSLYGTKPANPKAPEGQKVEPEVLNKDVE